MHDPWRRHILDSAQIIRFLDSPARHHSTQPLTLVDLGSGAGFPGLVLAILTNMVVHVIECNHKKCAFLTQVAAATDTGITVHCRRIEDTGPIAADIITARALAPLNKLLGYAHHLSGPTACLVTLKGKNWRHELVAARKMWQFKIHTQSSMSDSYGRLLYITDYHPLGRPSAEPISPP